MKYKEFDINKNNQVQIDAKQKVEYINQKVISNIMFKILLLQLQNILVTIQDRFKIDSKQIQDIFKIFSKYSSRMKY